MLFWGAQSVRLHPTGKCVHVLFLQQKILFIFGNFNCDHDLSLTKPFYFPKLLFCSILLIYKKIILCVFFLTFL